MTPDQLLPQNIEAEQAVLGAILIDNEVVGYLAHRLKPGDFHLAQHAWVYEAMLQLYDHRKPIDYVTVIDHMRALKQQHAKQRPADRPREWADIDLAQLADIAERTPTSANALHYAVKVRGRAILRRLIEAGNQIVSDAYDHAGDLAEFMEDAERRFLAVTRGDDSGGEGATGAQALQELCDQMDRAAEADGITGVTTGLADLDQLTAGFRPGEYVVLAGRPSMGKSALANCIVGHALLESGLCVYYQPQEVDRATVTLNILSARTRIPQSSMRRGALNDEQREVFTEAAMEFKAASIFYGEAQWGWRQIESRMRRLKDRGRLDLAVFDYLQILRPLQPDRSREREVAALSAWLKGLLLELEVPGIVVAQINRDAEKRASPRPRMSDLRESGSIEQDADAIMFVHREHYYTRNPADAGRAELILAKQRNGVAGVDIPLRWTQGCLLFETADPFTRSERRAIGRFEQAAGRIADDEAERVAE